MNTLARAAGSIALAALALAPAASAAHAQAAPIVLDGFFADWTAAVELADPAGDGGGSGIDFRQIDVANDDDWLFIRFQTTSLVSLQETATITLDLDTDANPATGHAVGGVGAELEWNFGARGGCFYPTASCVAIAQNAIRLRMLPSVTANEFELAISRTAKPNGTTSLFTGATIRVLLRDTGAGGDRAPDAGGLAYTFDPTPVAPPTPIGFARDLAADVRVVAWNTPNLESGSGFDPAVTPAADRVLSAIDPDVISFEEVYTPSAAATQSLVQSFLPASGPWYAAKQNDCIVVSRFPIVQSWPLDGNLAVRLATGARLDRDLLLVSAHLPCCTNDGGRRAEIDRIMAFLRDAMTVGGSVDVPFGTAFMIAGDLNLVGQASQLTSLLTGDIVDQATFGPDFFPDWDGTSLADVISSQTERRFAYTWRDDGSPYAPGRLDFLIYNDSVLERRHHFIVYSPEMSAAALAATGILANDVTTVSDHLPHAGDFRASGSAPVGGNPARGLALRAAVSPGRGSLPFTLELGFEASVTIEVFDARGARVRTLTPRAGLHLPPGRHAFLWDGVRDNGVRAESGVYFARVKARVIAFESFEVREARATWVLLH